MRIVQSVSKALQAIALVMATASFASVAFAQTDQSLRMADAAADRFGADANYHLGTGDQIRVIVYGEDDLGGQFTVDGNGFVSLPLIGQVKASGFAAPDLEVQIVNKLADGYVNNPKVSVEITSYRPFYVIGQVNKPEAFQNPQVSAERASVQLNDIGKLCHRRCVSLANSAKQPEHGDFQARRPQRTVVKFCRRQGCLTQTGA